MLLKFTDNKAKVSQFLEGHTKWIKRGFDDGVFLLAGSLQPNLGGAILVQNISLLEIQARMTEDPFVIEKVVNVEIIEFMPSKADQRLEFLLNGSG